MAAIYPRQPSNSKQVFNYTLPDHYIDPSTRQVHARYVYADSDHTPRMFIDPQHLMVASPQSPEAMDYDFPAAPFPVHVMANYEERNPPDFLNSGHRKRPAHGNWSQYQNLRSYDSERSSSHRASHHNTHAYHHPDLPTPPSSPTNTIPASVGHIVNVGRHHSSDISSSAASPTNTISASSSSTRYYCTHASCIDSATRKSIKSFSRRADLQRHHACTHDLPALYSCPRPNCVRKGENGFTRQDHLIEHRRGYHREVIPKRGQRGGDAKSPPRRR